MDVKRLRERWGPDQTTAVAAQFLAASRTRGQPDFESPFGTTEQGLLDLRGLTLHQSVRYATVRGADFSGAVFAASTVSESELERCRFDRCDLRGRFVGRRFTGCSFVGARLQQARLGAVFTECDFTKANLSGSVASGVRFERCDFTRARLGSIMWTQRCVFDQCVFDGLISCSGSVAGSRFIGTRPDSLERCITDHVRFIDIA